MYGSYSSISHRVLRALDQTHLIGAQIRLPLQMALLAARHPEVQVEDFNDGPLLAHSNASRASAQYTTFLRR
ncbi:hypothetical protein A9762_12160 [Pandoraea sp. ISTKB]|nr:hypothetical protein A9762_12160 [Pandoraea sp. ISTKB]